MDNCKGCSLKNKYKYLICKTYNYDQSCPCTMCITKMMDCSKKPNSGMNNCEKWTEWFYKNKGIEEMM